MFLVIKNVSITDGLDSEWYILSHTLSVHGDTWHTVRLLIPIHAHPTTCHFRKPSTFPVSVILISVSVPFLLLATNVHPHALEI